MFDITDRTSFDRVKKWVEELKQMLGEAVTLVIVGNKTDLAQTLCVPLEEAKRWIFFEFEKNYNYISFYKNKFFIYFAKKNFFQCFNFRLFLMI